MATISSLVQSADWKKEKHVPVIEAPDAPKKGEPVMITVSVGKELPHPNTTAHHIRWIAVYFLPTGEKFPCEIGQYAFNAHGESAQGADTGGVYTHPQVTVTFKTDKPGAILAASYCNIHGLWQGAKDITIT